MEDDQQRHAKGEGPLQLSAIYDSALPEVYHYLRARCGSTAVAEELTSATFVQAALTASNKTTSNASASELCVPWLITVARHKLIDHWRHQAVVERGMAVIEQEVSEFADPWTEVLDRERASQVLAAIPPHYRGVLTLRYLDDLSVLACAELLGRSVHATESLLVRARQAFRSAYEATGGRNE